jgi:hypothetical protein
MKNVLHDWEDEDAIRILRSCREAIAPGGRLLVAESVRPARPDDSLAGRMAAIGDVGMLINGGRERSLAEYTALLTKAGFRFRRLVPIVPDWIGVESQLIEAVAE